MTFHGLLSCVGRLKEGNWQEMRVHLTKLQKLNSHLSWSVGFTTPMECWLSRLRFVLYSVKCKKFIFPTSETWNAKHAKGVNCLHRLTMQTNISSKQSAEFFLSSLQSTVFTKQKFSREKQLEVDIFTGSVRGRFCEKKTNDFEPAHFQTPDSSKTTGSFCPIETSNKRFLLITEMEITKIFNWCLQMEFSHAYNATMWRVFRQISVNKPVVLEHCRLKFLSWALKRQFFP